MLNSVSSATNEPLMSCVSAPVSACVDNSLASPTWKACSVEIRLVAVGGEVQNGLQLGAEDHDRDHVAGGHLRAQELDGGVHRADLFLRLHRRDVEQHDDQPAVAQVRLLGAGVSGGGRRRGAGLGASRVCSVFGGTIGASGLRVQLLQLAALQGLQLAVFVNQEVACLQIADGLAVAAGHRQVNHHHVGRGGEGRPVCCELNWLASRAAVTTIARVFQNRNLITMSRVRMPEAAVGRP